MRRVVSGIFGVAALVCSGIGAAAAQIDFNSEYNTPQSGSITFTNGLHSVDVSAVNVDLSGKVTGNALIASYTGSNGGLGVCSGRASNWGDGCAGDSHKVDSSSPYEAALLDFGPLLVSLTSVTFAYADWNDDFDLMLYGTDGITPTQTVFDEYLGWSWSGVKTVDVTGMLAPGSIFGIGAADAGYYDYWDDFKIQSVGYSINASDLEAVPLPAPVLFLLSAFGGLWLTARRRAGAQRQ